DSAFRELYLAEDLEDQANPFGVEFIKRQIRPQSNEEPECFGIDLAKSVDWTVIVGLDSFGQICQFHRFQADWNQTRRRIIDIIGYTPTAIDSTGVGDPIVQDIQRSCPQVEGFHFSSNSKQQIMEGLASAIQNGNITILDGIMREEMEAFEFEYTRTGVRYTAPEGVHDDTVCALALANHKRVIIPGQT